MLFSSASTCGWEGPLGAVCPIAGKEFIVRITRNARANRFTIYPLRKRQSEDRLARLCSLQADVSRMILQDLLCDRETESDSILFSRTHEGLKQLFLNFFRDTGTVVLDADFNRVRYLRDVHADHPVLGRNELARVQQ